MIKTQTGRASKTQLLHMVSLALQGLNAGLFTALGYTADQALVIATMIGIAQGMIGFYLRTVTTESMQ